MDLLYTCGMTGFVVCWIDKVAFKKMGRLSYHRLMIMNSEPKPAYNKRDKYLMMSWRKGLRFPYDSCWNCQIQSWIDSSETLELFIRKQKCIFINVVILCVGPPEEPLVNNTRFISKLFNSYKAMFSRLLKRLCFIVRDMIYALL